MIVTDPLTGHAWEVVSFGIGILQERCVNCNETRIIPEWPGPPMDFEKPLINFGSPKCPGVESLAV